MSIAPTRARRRITGRTIAGSAIALTALAAGLLTAPAAFADPTPTFAQPNLSTGAGWNTYGIGAQYDYAFVAAGPHGTGASLRMSNSVDDGSYGNIQQLSTPAIAEAGESTTGAANHVFTAEFTIDAESYTAKPGLAVEVAADKGGNRAGGDLVFRQDVDNELRITNYFLPVTATGYDDADWRNATVDIPFTGPVKIRYVVDFKDAPAADVVRVYANNALVISTGGSFDRYTELAGIDNSQPTVGAVDSLLFRTNRNVPVSGAGWTRPAVTSGEKAANLGHGFFFSGVEYSSSNVASAPTTTVAVNASLSGTAVVGGVLTASAATNVINPTLSYQWLRSGLAIAGAKSATYTLTANDLNKKISVKVTAAKAGYTTGWGTSAQSDAILAATMVFTIPAAITGTAKLGSVLTVAGATTPGAGFSYQWFRNGLAIKGATAKTYTLAAADVGYEITARIVAAKAGYASLASTSLPTAPVEPGTLRVGTVTLTGYSNVGSVVTATTTGWTSGTTLKYAFYADGDLVQFSVSRSFKLTWEERGKRVTVIVLGSKLGYDKAESAESNPRGPVR